MRMRNSAIDMMKGWITVLMTCSHLSGITSFYANYAWARTFVLYVNLTSFSGFLFCFGYVCWGAYIENANKDVYKRLLKGAGRILVAFYISSLCLVMTLGNQRELAAVVKILLLRNVPSMSEFLLSFLLIYVVLMLFSKWMRKFSDWNIAVAIIFSLLSTYFPYNIVREPILGSVIGTMHYSCFPIVQYGCYFLAGMYLAKNKILFSKCLFLFSLVGTSMFCVYYYTQGLPRRFPPSLLWVVGAGFFVYCYFLVFNILGRRGICIEWLNYIGKHTLNVLVVGNVVYFLLRFITKETIQLSIVELKDIWKYFFWIVFIFALSYVIDKLGNKIKKIISMIKK